jgi:hypothetical protein
MSVRYLQSGQAEEAGFLATGGQIADDDDGGWSGLQRAFVGIALTVSLAASAFAAQVALRAQQDPEEVPAGSLVKFSTPDEDFWANPAQAVCRMQQVACRTNSTYDLPPTTYQSSPYLPDLNDDPAHTLAVFSTPDEDFWQNPTPPVPPSLKQPLPIAAGEPAEVPAQVVFQPDEDFWVNPVAPVLATVYQRLPYLPDLSDDPAGALAKFSTPDEDFWAAVAPAPLNLWQPLPIAAGEPGEIPPQAIFQPDEDFWVNPVAPVAPSVYQRLPYLPEPTDDPAGSLYGQPDEDFWFNPVAPLAPSVYQRLPYLPDLSDDPAGALAKFSTPDEDFWAAIAPAPLNLWQPLPIAAGEPGEIPPQAIFQPDEDFWVNPVAPLAPSVYQRLPYLPEPTDDPAGSLRRQPEEDFWTNPVAPAPSVVYQRLPYLPEVSDDPAGSLAKFSTPDEDYWQAMPGMPQVAWGIAPTYALRAATCQLWTDQADVPPRVFCPEDDAWGNPVQAVCRMSQVACGVNPTYGPPPAIYQPLVVWETEPFACCWWTTRWGMRTHSIARARASHSLARARESHSAARARVSRGASRQS